MSGNYLRQYLRYHLTEAGLTRPRDALAIDQRWVCGQLRRFGPASVVADLLDTGGPDASAMAQVVERTAHLLADADPDHAVAPILLDHLETNDRWSGRARTFRDRLAVPQLVARTPLPDRPDPRLRRVLAGHDGPATGCDLAPDGSWVISAGADGTVRTWDAATGRQRNQQDGHQGGVLGCSAGADGTWFATVGVDMRVRVWDMATGQLRRSLNGHVGKVYACAAGAAGDTLVSVGGDGTLRSWNLGDGRPRTLFERHRVRLRACALSPDGGWAAVGGASRMVRLVDTATGRVTHALPHTDEVTGIAVAAGGARLVTTCLAGNVRLWDLAVPEPAANRHDAGRHVRACAVAPDGAWLMIAGDDVRTAYMSTGHRRLTLTGHEGLVTGCAIAPDGTWLMTTGMDGEVRVWDASTGRTRFSVGGHRRSGASGCAVAPDGSWILTTGADGSICTWSAGGERRASIDGHRGAATGCAIAPDGSWMTTTGADGTVRTWNVNGEPGFSIDGHQGAVTACAIAPDGSWMVTTGVDGRVKVWSTRDGAPLAEVAGHRGAATGCAIDVSGSYVVTTGKDCTVVVWGGLAAGEPERITMTRVSRPLTCVECVDVRRDHVVVCGGEAGTYLFTYRPQRGAIDI